MQKNAVPICFVALLLVLSSACGWHLRGSEGHTVAFERLHISSPNLHGDLVRQLTRQFEASGVELVESATGASYSLVIMNEDAQRRTATVSASARVSERSLTEIVEFVVLDRQGAPVIPRSKVMVERIFEYDESNVLAADDEARLLKREMQEDLARQIYNRLRLLKKPASANAPAS